MLNFFKKKNFPLPVSAEELFLAIDIGTEYVKVAVYRLDGMEVEVIGYARRKQMESTMYAAYIVNLKEAKDTVDKCIGDAVLMAREVVSEDNFSLPKQAIIGIAGELVQGVTVVVNLERNAPDTPINQSEIDSIIAKLKKQTFESTKEEISQEIGLKPNQIDEIDTYINSVYVDGVRVLNPLGYVGSEMVYNMYSTFAPKLHINSVKQLAEQLNLSILKLVVEPYALSLALKDIRDKNASSILLDIGGGTTDVALVHNGDLAGTKMFAIGGRVFTKSIQKYLNLDFDQAEQIKLDYSNNKVDSERKREVSTIIGNSTKIWLDGVEIALSDFDDVTTFPAKFLVCGGGALLPDIQEGLISYPWQNYLPFPKHPKVDFIFPNHITKLTDKTRTATLPMDVTPLALARMHLEI